MTVRVVKMERDPEGKNCVTLESDKDGLSPDNAFSLAITELQSGDTKKVAITHAAGTVPNACCGMPTHPYPVDAEGNVVVNSQEQAVNRYRVDVPITQGFR